ncbi:hypothetical protein J437_LFUL008952 [Ladona fulva]|uniref:Uncharacterized protein n=1 Tax=Ladona fulva TaxID=123851 RepID=A0A8K0KFD6_LADFU|nr:hypothetical protein J437_LFUL008952 [Ladona fulva]
MQKNGAGLHYASSCLWDTSQDGTAYLQWENETMNVACDIVDEFHDDDDEVMEEGTLCHHHSNEGGVPEIPACKYEVATAAGDGCVIAGAATIADWEDMPFTTSLHGIDSTGQSFSPFLLPIEFTIFLLCRTESWVTALSSTTSPVGVTWRKLP